MTPTITKRCELCMTPVETSVNGPRSASFQFAAHSDDLCRKATVQRLLVLQELLTESLQREQLQEHGLRELAQWIGPMAEIIDIGRRWIVESDKRWSDIDRLRKATGTGEVDHPLWQLERQLADAIRKSIAQIEMRSV